LEADEAKANLDAAVEAGESEDKIAELQKAYDKERIEAEEAKVTADREQREADEAVAERIRVEE
jgi:hypothetical protein